MANREIMLLGLCLSIAALAACGDDESPASSEQPDAGNPNGSCEPEPLSAFCTSSQDCPDSFQQAVQQQCGLNPTNTFTQQSSCGRSVFTNLGLGEVVYHFDGDERLVGVHESTDLVLACSDEPNAPSSAERDYGRVCTLSGLPMLACPGPCPAIACRAGALLKARWPFDFEQAKGSPITACHNDLCFTGMLSATAPMPTPDSGTGFTVPSAAVIDRDETGHFQVRFRGASGGGVYLEVEWTPWADSDLNDGDRYRVTAEVGGMTRALIDREVEYGVNELDPGGPCQQRCPFASVDLREIDDTDGGVDEDDAGR